MKYIVHGAPIMDMEQKAKAILYLNLKVKDFMQPVEQWIEEPLKIS